MNTNAHALTSILLRGSPERGGGGSCVSDCTAEFKDRVTPLFSAVLFFKMSAYINEFVNKSKG